MQLNQSDSSGLIRGLRPVDALSLVMGSMIGTGVFLKTGIMTQMLSSPALVIAAWLVGGLMCLAGALIYAELSSMMPETGGEFVFLKNAYGNTTGFFYGWMRFLFGGAAVAAYGSAFSTFLSVIIPAGAPWLDEQFSVFGQTVSFRFGSRNVLAVGVVLFIVVINSIGVILGGRVQTLLTIAKLLGISAVIAGAYFFSGGAGGEENFDLAVNAQWTGAGAFGAAVLACLWAYSGWSFLPMVAGEVQNPERTIPRAVILGTSAVIIIYLLINAAYFVALPLEEILTSSSAKYPDAPAVAAKVVRTFLGESGSQFMAIVFMISTIGALNGSFLSAARIPYAMAANGLFFSRFKKVGEKTHVPMRSIWILGTWACVLAASGTFDQLSNIAMFAYWIFFTLAGFSLFIFRRKMPDHPRPYKTAGYPYVPAAFVLVAGWLVINTIITQPLQSVSAMIVILLGLPILIYVRRK